MTGADVIIRVALPVPLFMEYDYLLVAPAPLPCLGGRVRVPFGRRELVGICTAISPEDPHAEPRAAIEWLDDHPLVGSHMLQLIRWVSGYYHHPLGEVMTASLPALARTGEPAVQKRPVWWELQVDPSTGDQGAAGAEEAAPTPYQALLATLNRAPRQKALVQYLASFGPTSDADLVAAGFGRELLRALATRGLIQPARQPEGRATAGRSGPVVPADDYRHLIEPTEQQRLAISDITDSFGSFRPWLLEGVTGSGKTEVYLRLIEAVIQKGGQALLLVPEISLTPQTIGRVRSRFPDSVSFHSAMTDRERWGAYLACRDGSASVLVGTRSAIFTQFSNLRLIIIDEEHDASFKQQDNLRYSARDVAVRRAQMLGIPIVLGSATPALESVDNVRKGRYGHLQLTSRPGASAVNSFHVLDIRGHQLDEGLSHDLIRVMDRHLKAGGQVLTYINRRGFSPALLCSTCGWTATCTRCDSRLTVHRQPVVMRCHHCGFETPVPLRCEQGHQTLVPLGVGTQRTEAALERIFKDVPVLRIDRDTTRSARQLEAHLATVHMGKPMILVGTQMLAKGHHFPDVSLVAIINADHGFLSADFRAPERTAQTIIQVAGRAGRAERRGEVWIQSLQPEHPSLQRLVHEGYGAFARDELDNRLAAGLPPATAMALIRADATTADEAFRFLEHLKARIGPGITVAGPVPAPIQRISNRHRLQLLLLAKSRNALQRCCLDIRSQPSSRTLRWSIDVDPYDSA